MTDPNDLIADAYGDLTALLTLIEADLEAATDYYNKLDADARSAVAMAATSLLFCVLPIATAIAGTDTAGFLQRFMVGVHREVGK